MKRKFDFWKAFKDCDVGTKRVFAELGKQAVFEDHIVRQLEHHLCLLSQPDTTLATLIELRWWVFRHKQAEAERLPPIKAALIQAIKKHLFNVVSGIMTLLLIRIYHHHQSMD